MNSSDAHRSREHGPPSLNLLPPSTLGSSKAHRDKIHIQAYRKKKTGKLKLPSRRGRKKVTWGPAWLTKGRKKSGLGDLNRNKKRIFSKAVLSDAGSRSIIVAGRSKG